MKRTQMTISFGEYDDDVYNFLQGQKNASALIRRLVRGYMGGNVAPPANTQTVGVVTPPQAQERIVEKTSTITDTQKIEKNRAQMPDL